MSIQSSIATTFEGKAFLRPLFYTYPRGLRFELSEGGSFIQQFLKAHQKAITICSGVFDDDAQLTVCLRFRPERNAFAHRSMLRQLGAAGVRIPKHRELWAESIPSDERVDENVEAGWLNLAFEASRDLLPGLLWCAFAQDFSIIRPRPACAVYLFNLSAGILVFPDDDRGMDVVGPNHAMLSALYHKHRQALLDYDREAMVETFEN